MLEFQSRIVRLHFALLILIVFNLIVKTAFDFGFANDVLVMAKFILYGSGIFLFFAYLKPFKIIAAYFSFFLLTPIVIAIFFVVHGIFFGLLSSLVLAPIMPLEPEYTEGNLNVYSKFNGFLGNCCEYYVTKSSFYIFEEQLGSIGGSEHINFQNSKIVLMGDSIRIDTEVYPITNN